MLRIKRLYTFIYQTFLPVFAMTFGICLFIFIIQFLWQHIDKLVGKGLDTSVIVEFFLYASLMLIPQVLPLAILLASLMTFGNMGEKLELVAIKASGVSLMKIMKPMIILISLFALGSFFFQNKVAPKINVKVYSLLYSIKQKSPELDIPEGAFYNELRGYSIYVKEKDLETHMLHGVIIYDTSSGGFKNMSVDVCDSAIMKVSESKDYLTLSMFDGERFSNLKDEPGRKSNKGTTGASDEFVPYIRERFQQKDIIIPFNDDFVRIDESRYDDTQIAKDLKQLDISIDSLGLTVDSLNQLDRKTITAQSFLSHSVSKTYVDSLAKTDVEEEVLLAYQQVQNFDSVFNALTVHDKANILSIASGEARSMAGNHLLYFHIDTPKPKLQRDVRMHQIFWHKMFTIPFACLVFFFIGAPLGAIIRKGGLGVPVIISVVLFIIYYIIGNIGYKMARDGLWPAWQGEWLSAAVLFPLGVFLTYKSMNESALFNTEVYGKYFKKIFMIKEPQESERKINREDINIPRVEEVTSDFKLISDYRDLDNTALKDMAMNYHAYGHGKDMGILAMCILHERGEDISNLIEDNNLFFKEEVYDSFIKSSYWSLGGYVLTLATLTAIKFDIGHILEISYVLLFLRSLTLYVMFYSRTKEEKNAKHYIKHTLTLLVTFVAYPIMFLYIRRNMLKELEKVKNTSIFINE